jgi:hypothetical protein
MALPTVSLSWDFTKINQRETYSTVNDATAFTFFTMWRYWIDTLGWTVKYTCDGTTGPSSSSDPTDRLTTKAACSHRGASTTAAQSFGVATDGGGADHLLAYVGAGTSPTGDDLFYIAFSPTGVYVPAATATNTPTATDQVLVMNSLTLVGAGAADRVISMQGSSDKKNFRLWVYSAATLQREYFIERCISTVNSSWNWTDPLVVGQLTAITAGNAAVIAGGSLAASPAGAQGTTNMWYAKIGGTIVQVGGGGEMYLGGGGAGTFAVANPELNGASPIVPLVFASKLTNIEGKLGNRQDAWFSYANGITDASSFGSSPNFQFQFINSRLVPWDGASALVTT